MKIGRFVRHPAFRRGAVVRRHLLRDTGYAWRGEETLRKRLAGAGLDAARALFAEVDTGSAQKSASQQGP